MYLFSDCMTEAPIERLTVLSFWSNVIYLYRKIYLYTCLNVLRYFTSLIKDFSESGIQLTLDTILSLPLLHGVAA